MQVTHSNQYRQTTTMSEDLLGEQTMKQQQPAQNKVCISLCVRGSQLESVCEKEREKARVGVKVELSSKQSQIPPAPTPVSGQLNHQESGKIPSPPSLNSTQNHISMTSPWQMQYFQNTLSLSLSWGL